MRWWPRVLPSTSACPASRPWSSATRVALALGFKVAPIAFVQTKPTQGRAGTKQAQLVAMLEAPEGASTEEIVAAFGWQPHTVRGAIAGALKKRLGLQVGSEAIEGRGRVYRIMP